LVDFIKTLKSVSAAVNKGLPESSIDKSVELIEIEPLHTTINGNSMIIVIEPADLSIDNNVSIGMSAAGEFYGRAEGLATYTGTKRSIRLDFKMIKSQVLNGAQAVSNNTITANLLQQLLYPSYTPTGMQSTSVIKTPPFFRIKYGDLIGDFSKGQKKGLTGFFSSLNVSSGGGYGGGGIGDNLTFGVGGVKIPITYDVNMQFDVLHEHVLGWYDGKFANDGRNNWPFNSGVNIDSSADGPGFEGGNPGAGIAENTPGSPDSVAAKVLSKPQ